MSDKILKLQAIEAARTFKVRWFGTMRAMLPHADHEADWLANTDRTAVMSRFILATAGEECFICGGTEHLPPLPGTVGKRCVKCCDLKGSSQ